jgi:hypothetical protein
LLFYFFFEFELEIFFFFKIKIQFFVKKKSGGGNFQNKMKNFSAFEQIKRVEIDQVGKHLFLMDQHK